MLCILFIPSNLSLTPVDTQIDLGRPKSRTELADPSGEVRVSMPSGLPCFLSCF